MIKIKSHNWVKHKHKRALFSHSPDWAWLQRYPRHPGLQCGCGRDRGPIPPCTPLDGATRPELKCGCGQVGVFPREGGTLQNRLGETRKQVQPANPRHAHRKVVRKAPAGSLV